MNNRELSIAGVVVLYNPQRDVIDNIKTYIDRIDRLYVIDNSEILTHKLETVLVAFNNATYINNGGNLGVARALNIGAELAIKDGYDFLLTMDQDSKIQPGMIEAMLDCNIISKKDELGIITPVHLYAYSHEANHDRPCDEIMSAMTSGNLLNLKAYRSAGPFSDHLFIDYVDEEYCLRLHAHGFKIIRANNAMLEHSPGVITEHRFFSRKFAIGNYPPLRRYYGIRNRFYLLKHYKQLFPVFFRLFYWNLFRELAVIVVYENDKINKIHMMFKGYRDYRNGKFGKYQP